MTVRLTTPGNELLDGLEGVLLSPDPADGYATARGDRFRVLVTPRGRDRPAELRLEAGEFEVTTPPTGTAMRARSGASPTGNVCPGCQGSNLVRTGSCVTCQDCGANEGCG